MQSAPDKLAVSVSEAGFVIDKPARIVNRAIDQGEIDAKTSAATTKVVQAAGKAKATPRRQVRVRIVGRAELRYLMVLAAGLDKDLTPAGRRRIYQGIKQLPANEHRLRWGSTWLELDAVDAALSDRLARLETLKRAVDSAGRDEPVLRGTEVPVYPVAALARGETIEEILEDYPGLSREQVEVAIDYASAYPKPGRPYPERSFKRMLADLADSGGLDADPEEPATPDMFR